MGRTDADIYKINGEILLQSNCMNISQNKLHGLAETRSS
jgi:hypothetical protein